MRQASLVRRAVRRHAAGFTLLELLVSFAIAAWLLVLAGGALHESLLRYQQRSQADALAQALHLARGEAIKRSQRVDVCPTLDGVGCDPGGRWELGWMVFADINGDGDRDAGEDIVRIEAPARQGITVRGNQPVGRYVSYTPLGHTRLTSGALQMGTFTVCVPGQDVIEVVLANGGRPRIQEMPARCP